ncbi:transposase, partial in ISC1234 [Saccharolobus solfataricus]|uniref:Transposase, partial in ISC1234 n=1 Tax=Saccharolobus solfataricus TaxID=2287 RepID=A0A157T4F8_SACSO
MELPLDIVVRWFLRQCKSETHRRAKKLKEEIKILFREYGKKLEKKMITLADYLPSSALYGKVGELWTLS